MGRWDQQGAGTARGTGAGPSRGRPAPRICILGGFRLAADGELLRVSPGAEHVLAFVALYRSAVPRCLVAGTLWPDVAENRAHACLRSALTRLEGAAHGALAIGSTELALAEGVAVDLREARSLARAVLDAGGPARAGPAGPSGLPRIERARVGAAEIAELSEDLLPGWCDEWALRAAEEWRQLRLHALETLAAHFISSRRYAHAVAAAGSAVRADPLRESAQITLIKAHLAEGNKSEALRDFRRYQCLLRRELGLRPTAQLLDLVASIR